MDRLTGRDERGNLLVNGKMVYAGNLYDAASKLEEYEDLEEQLEKTYGECDGLLKTAIKIIMEVEKYGVDFEKPNKSRLLTDDDAEKWIRWKESDKQGKLIELPCKPGDTVYIIAQKHYSCNKKEKCDDFDCENYNSMWCEIFCPNGYDGIGIVKCKIVSIDFNEDDIYYWLDRTNVKKIDELYLTEQEAKEALEEMKK